MMIVSDVLTSEWEYALNCNKTKDTKGNIIAIASPVSVLHLVRAILRRWR